MPGLAQDGQQAGAEAGQVASLTSTNNFINFCLTEPDLPLTNGMQVRVRIDYQTFIFSYTFKRAAHVIQYQ